MQTRPVAERLSQLPDDWHICWGYYYSENKREGDFIILGPKGQFLVMEVKGGQNRQFALTGRWENSRDGDNPLEQLRAEWDDILGRVQKESSDGTPWVGHALCMPYLNLEGITRLHHIFGDALLISGKDLENFEGWWKSNLESHPNHCRKPAKVYQKAIVPHLKPAGLNLFIKETDRLFHRYQETESEFLDMLAENRQWIVEGGPGTGKTFLALQRAQQLAESGTDGMRVLFICYNLILARQITDLVAQLKPVRGEIVVKSWEALVEDILAREDIEIEHPPDAAGRYQYFCEEVPSYVCEILSEKGIIPEYDALVVDEAQDHDTSFSGQFDQHPLGWWSWYFALVRDGLNAPVALFLDQAQRPRFRDPDQFSLEALRNALPSSTHVRLKRVLRYTRQVHAYLANLPFPIAREFAGLAIPGSALPEGPEVIELSASDDEIPKAIEAIVREWTGKKLCKTDDIVIMGFRRELADFPIGHLSDIAGYPLCDYTPDAPRGSLRYSGIHRAKGLDFLGVILIDLPTSEALADKEDVDRMETFFYGATRARQLLGIISPIEETSL